MNYKLRDWCCEYFHILRKMAHKKHPSLPELVAYLPPLCRYEPFLYMYDRIGMRGVAVNFSDFCRYEPLRYMYDRIGIRGVAVNFSDSRVSNNPEKQRWGSATARRWNFNDLFSSPRLSAPLSTWVSVNLGNNSPRLRFL